MIAGSMSSAPVPGATGLSEPLLGDGGGDGGALTKVVVATALDGKAKANKGSEAKDGYWVEVPRQLDAAAATAADLESGGGDGGRPRALMLAGADVPGKEGQGITSLPVQVNITEKKRRTLKKIL